MIAAVDFKNGSPDLASADQEKLDASQDRAQPELQKIHGSPDIQPEADTDGRTTPRGQQARPPQRPPNFLERLFGPRKPASPPAQRNRWPF